MRQCTAPGPEFTGNWEVSLGQQVVPHQGALVET